MAARRSADAAACAHRSYGVVVVLGSQRPPTFDR
jgi:hypothetical protein